MTQDSTQDVNAAAQREIEELRRKVDELTGKYGPAVQGSFAEMKDTVSQGMGDIEKQIREKPVQATLIAAGVGFLIGALLTR
jgi:ElaB/YqjD/DUF883 family membrane-anchored ribosome-binding protein